MSDTSETWFYLTVRGKKRGRGYDIGSPRCTKNKPGIASDEITIKINLKLPNALFERPTLQAEIAVADDQIGQSTLNAEVINNITGLARTAGIDLKIIASEVIE